MDNPAEPHLTDCHHSVIPKAPFNLISSKKKMFRFCGVILLMAVAFVLAASQEPETRSEKRGSEANGEDLVHFGDLVDVDVVGSFEFDWRGRLTPEGFLDGYDRIAEPILALCQNEEAIAGAIRLQLSRILREPVVKVSIVDRSGRPSGFLNGAIKIPQRFQIRREVRLIELLIIAGGIGDNAGGGIQIFRPRNASCSSTEMELSESVLGAGFGGSQSINIQIADLLAGKPEANPLIRTGDIVTVLETLPVYVVGGIGNPGPVAFRENMSLSRAIAVAGGTVKSADEKKISIYRREGANTVVIEADLSLIASEKTDDPLLRAFDIVEVREKGRGVRRFPSTGSGAIPTAKSERRLPLRIID